MYSRAPVDYICPFCSLVERGEDEFGDRKDDIVFSDEFLTAFVSSHWWPNVNGAVLVIPNKHYENIFDISDEYYVKVQLFAKHLAPIMMKAYSCKGISTRQHNIAGNQSVWHYHLQVLPRYDDDRLYQNHDKKYFVEQKLRKEYADKIKKYL